MKDTKYNGWTNWETWNFKLWMDNDQSFNPNYHTYNSCDEIENTHQVAKHLERDIAEMWLDDVLDKNSCGFFHDVCNMAIREINFYEIAERLILERENDS